MTNLNALRTAMKRDREQAQQIEDEEQYQREKEREEAEWREYLEAEIILRRRINNSEIQQSTKTDNE